MEVPESERRAHHKRKRSDVEPITVKIPEVKRPPKPSPYPTDLVEFKSVGKQGDPLVEDAAKDLLHSVLNLLHTDEFARHAKLYPHQRAVIHLGVTAKDPTRWENKLVAEHNTNSMRTFELTMTPAAESNCFVRMVVMGETTDRSDMVVYEVVQFPCASGKVLEAFVDQFMLKKYDGLAPKGAASTKCTMAKDSAKSKKFRNDYSGRWFLTTDNEHAASLLEEGKSKPEGRASMEAKDIDALATEVATTVNKIATDGQSSLNDLAAAEAHLENTAFEVAKNMAALQEELSAAKAAFKAASAVGLRKLLRERTNDLSAAMVTQKNLLSQAQQCVDICHQSWTAKSTASYNCNPPSPPSSASDPPPISPNPSTGGESVPTLPAHTTPPTQPLGPPSPPPSSSEPPGIAPMKLPGATALDDEALRNVFPPRMVGKTYVLTPQAMKEVLAQKEMDDTFAWLEKFTAASDQPIKI